mmetsp:Transcript_350/g.1110  ORF Transcript_350/g.1110 Transcript_350/m.1110 type:complete len:232 (+) Transcript_350:1195-1890(+)|eukprot:scaffold33724_cov32-Tisochrysis_lutea.AAC.1
MEVRNGTPSHDDVVRHLEAGDDAPVADVLESHQVGREPRGLRARIPGENRVRTTVEGLLLRDVNGGVSREVPTQLGGCGLLRADDHEGGEAVTKIPPAVAPVAAAGASACVFALALGAPLLHAAEVVCACPRCVGWQPAARVLRGCTECGRVPEVPARRTAEVGRRPHAAARPTAPLTQRSAAPVGWAQPARGTQPASTSWRRAGRHVRKHDVNADDKPCHRARARAVRRG